MKYWPVYMAYAGYTPQLERFKAWFVGPFTMSMEQGKYGYCVSKSRVLLQFVQYLIPCCVSWRLFITRRLLCHELICLTFG